MNPTNPVVNELEAEGRVTARVLERIPEEHLGWKPHEKSMSLGQLALHIATTPGLLATIIATDTFQVDPAAFQTVPQPASRAEVLAAHEKSIAEAKQYVSGLNDEQMAATFRFMNGSNELLALPRANVIRSIMLNHCYHHRGQLSVYLRLLGVPVPSIYGPSADENPFTRRASA